MNDVYGAADQVTKASVLQDHLQMGQSSKVLVNEHILNIQLDGLCPLGIDAHSGFFHCVQHAQRGAKYLLGLPLERVEPAPAKSVNERDSKSLPPSRIEGSLLEIPYQVADQNLMLSDTVRIDLCRSVLPVVVTLCQAQAFLLN